MSSDLQERLAMALCGATPGHWRAISGATKKSALKDVEPLLPTVRQAQAEAWDEAASHAEHQEWITSFRADDLRADNPYREGDTR